MLISIIIVKRSPYAIMFIQILKHDSYLIFMLWEHLYLWKFLNCFSFFHVYLAKISSNFTCGQDSFHYSCKTWVSTSILPMDQTWAHLDEITKQSNWHPVRVMPDGSLRDWLAQRKTFKRRSHFLIYVLQNVGVYIYLIYGSDLSSLRWDHEAIQLTSCTGDDRWIAAWLAGSKKDI